MKRKILDLIIVSLMFIVVCSIFCSLSNAINSRYYHWYLASTTGVNINGTWDYWTFDRPHQREIEVLWKNYYPQEEMRKAGHYTINAELFPDISMGYRIGESMPQLFFYSYVEDAVFGYSMGNKRLHCVFNPEGYIPTPSDLPTWIRLECFNGEQFMDGNWNRSLSGKGLRLRFETTDSPVVDEYGYHKIYVAFRVEICNQDGSLAEVLFAHDCSTWGVSTSFLPENLRYVYGVYCDFYEDYYGWFTMKAFTPDNLIGHHCDVRASDFKDDMRDTGFVSRLYGLSMWNMGINFWWNATNAWVADVDANLKIDMVDVAYIARNFGTEG